MDPPKDPTQSRRVLVGGVVLLLLVFAGSMAYRHFARDRPADLKESPDDKRRALQEAFGDQPPAHSPSEQRAELETFFASLGKAYAAADGNAIGDHFDFIAMLRLAAERGLMDPLPERTLTQMAPMLRTAQGQRFAQTAKFSAWDEIELVKLTYLDEEKRDAVVVYTRDVRTEGKYIGKMRWWLRWRDDRWRAYDVEDLSMGLRTSTMIGAAISASNAGAAWGGSLEALIETFRAVAEGRFDDLERTLPALRNVAFPAPLKAMVHFIDSSYAMYQGEYPQALELMDQAQKLAPDMVMLDLQRMTVFNLQGEHLKAVEAGKCYVEALGRDADAEFAIAFLGLGDRKKAHEHLASCLDDVTDQLQCVQVLARCITPEETELLDARLRALTDFDSSMATLLQTAIDELDGAAARALLAATERRDPKHPLLAQHAAAIRSLPASP